LGMYGFYDMGMYGVHNGYKYKNFHLQFPATLLMSDHFQDHLL